VKKLATKFPDVWIISPDVFADDRGFFFESYSYKKFDEIGISTKFVQDNHSKSARNTVRGLHYQLPPGQAKLIRCTLGTIWDVIVDIRKSSPTFKKWFAVELSDENKKILYIPVGYAHGFCVVTEIAEVQYKVSNFYDAKLETEILWNDPEIAIPWPITKPILSKRDEKASPLRDSILY
jgi:dTDP-4-dehydrorhamnose 3,5-epimerase